MKSLSIRARMLATALSVLPSMASPAFAQSSPASAENAGLEEIVVTAQRRSESVLSVPLSIEARTGDQLNASGIRNVSELQFTSPGFVVATANGFSQLFVRGVGNSVFTAADPSVSTYVDDVPRPYGERVSAFVDIERVEVLKGAQGGLYGRNATGGVVNIITRQPSVDEIHASGQISYGEKNTFKAAGYFNLPISEKIALMVSADREKHSAYVRNLAIPNPFSAANFPTGAFLPTGPGRSFAFNSPAQAAAAFNSGTAVPKLDNLNLWTIGAKLLLQATDDFKITLYGDYAKKKDNQGQQQFNRTPAVAAGLATSIFGAFGVNYVPTAGSFAATAGKFTSTDAEPALLNLRDYGGAAIAVLSLPTVELTSISAVRYHRKSQEDDLGNLVTPTIWVHPFNKATYYYQEVRAVSTGTGPFRFLGGATYLRNVADIQIATDILPPLIIGALTRAHQVQQNYSVYGQVGYDFTPELSLTVSGRYVGDKNRIAFSQPAPGAAHLSANKFLPSATLSYKLEGGGNVYARWARGFKGGGINPALSPAVFGANLTGSVFDPEQVDTYETGFRSTFFDRKVQLTAAAFYNDYKGLQVATQGNAQHPEIIFAIVNAGSARTYGVEGSLTWRAAPPLTLGINAGYLNAKYKKFSLLNNPVLAAFDRSGHQMIFSPKTQISLTAALDQPVTDQLRLVGTALASHLSRTLYQEAAFAGLPDAAQPAYWLVNLRVGVKTTDDKYGFSVFVNNAFNKAYATAGGSATSTGTQGTWGDPRIIGAELSIKF